jgi:hypothetical protein
VQVKVVRRDQEVTLPVTVGRRKARAPDEGQDSPG